MICKNTKPKYIALLFRMILSGSDFSDLYDNKIEISDEFMYNQNKNNHCCSDELNFNQKFLQNNLKKNVSKIKDLKNQKNDIFMQIIATRQILLALLVSYV